MCNTHVVYIQNGHISQGTVASLKNKKGAVVVADKLSGDDAKHVVGLTKAINPAKYDQIQLVSTVLQQAIASGEKFDGSPDNKRFLEALTEYEFPVDLGPVLKVSPQLRAAIYAATEN